MSEEAAERPLRIALIGWAGLALQEREGTGYNLHVSEFAAGLAAEGHRVSYLRSGMDYALRPGMYIRPRQSWRSVQCFDLVNSPNLSVAFFNFKNVQDQISVPRHTALVLKWLREQHAEIVHIHSLEGFGFDLVQAIRDAGWPVLVTPHNYYALCPQVDLLHNEVNVCDDYEGGRRCENCLGTPDPHEEIKRRKWNQSSLGTISNAIVRDCGRATRLITQRLKGVRDGDAAPPPPPAAKPTLPNRPTTPADMNSRLLEATHHLKVLSNNSYGNRRVAGVGAMNAATAVLCPSRFLMGVHAAMGVDHANMRHVALGQPHFDAIAAAAEQSAFFTQPPWTPGIAARPLRFGFFGSTRYNKGLDVLVRAIRHLDPRIRAKCHFHIRAGGDTSAFRAFLEDIPEVSFFGSYTPAEIPTTLGSFDVGIVPTTGLENSPFVILEHLHAGKFVIGSKLGGPTDFIDEPRNGLLIPAGNPAALADAMSALVAGNTRIPSPRDVRRASRLRTFPEYLAEINDIYRKVISGGDALEPTHQAAL